jgi:hypothetical protein
VDDDRARGALAGRHVVLVVPAPVVEAGLPGEDARVVLRVVVHDEEDLALEVRALVVVPLELGGGDPVAHEDDLRRVHAHLRLGRVREGHVVVRVAELDALRSPADLHDRRARRGDADELDLLLPAPAGSRGLEAHRLHPGADVRAREPVAAGAGAASLEQIVGEEADVGPNCVAANGVGRRFLVGSDDCRLHRGERDRGQSGQRDGEGGSHALPWLRILAVHVLQ